MFQRASRRKVVKTSSIPAPVGGLNARDAIANMPPTDAVQLENMFPQASSVDLRNGCDNHLTGLGAWTESLMAYNNATSSKLFAAAGTAFYDASSSGAVGAAVQSGLTNAKWQHINVTTAGGSYLYCVNGVDKPRLYDGSSWTSIDSGSTPAITGVTTTLLVHIHQFKNRVWFVEKDSMRVWYLPLDSIGGAASSINFGSLFKLGGYLMAMTSWSIDNTGGVDDYAAFITSQGEVALYRGIDPTYTSTWALVGLFRIGRPIGRRCTVRIGADVAVITADGVVMLSQALPSERTQTANSISSKIQPLINTDVQAYSGNFGWQLLLHPIGNKLILNVPQVENSIQYQYVMNTITGAWTKFTGWNAACWELFGDNIYYGGATAVVKADYGQDDNNSAITAYAKPAFSYFGNRGQNKRFTMVRPIFNCDGNLTPSIALCTDFGDRMPSSTPSYSPAGGSQWDVSLWDVTYWGGSGSILKSWQSVTGVGFSASMKMKIQASGLTVQWQSTDYVYEPGGIL